MQGELNNLVQLYQSLGLAGEDTEAKIKEAISRYLIGCPVYRYYDDAIPVMERDLGKNSPQLKQFYARCMQFTGPVMAKGVEDTLMYTYNRFICHNEVGDFPGNFGISRETFHNEMVERRENWPLSINATATHDTKRGEDVRARLNVLSDLHEEWLEAVNNWFNLNKDIRGTEGPDANDEYFIYQSLIGHYPMPGEEETDFKERFTTYLTKALRESKRKSDWAEPDEAYENASRTFAARLLDKQRPFWKSFKAFLEKLAPFGIVNSLAQVILKLSCPGIPDIYQGCELWDLSFVDPDNRRPVDYPNRRKWLQEIKQKREEQGFTAAFWENPYNAAIKLWLIYALLQVRRKDQDLFTSGDYIPLETAGTYKENILAFCRHYQQHWFLIALPLHPATLCKRQQNELSALQWDDTRIILPPNSPDSWIDLLNNQEVHTGQELLLQGLLPFTVLSTPVTAFSVQTGR